MVDMILPDKIVVSGWANKWYLRICRSYRKKSVCILTMDNHWRGSLKQQLFKLAFRLTFAQVFTKIWIPGQPQLGYAKRLGFKDDDIIRGFYCCDTNFYLDAGRSALRSKRENFPKRILCVARYIPQKNYRVLWNAFIQWKSQTTNDWELWCAGAGEQFEERIEYPEIRHLGFVQKGDWSEIIEQTSVFVLPSRFEPWGVAVHEFASLGYPLILSDKVGAASLFLRQQNGFCFSPDDESRLVEIFRQIDGLSVETLLSMGKSSRELGQQITTQKWARLLLDA